MLARADHRPRHAAVRRHAGRHSRSRSAPSARWSSTWPTTFRGRWRCRGAREVRADGPRRWLQFNRLETTAAELIADVAARYPLHDLTIEEPDIETIVRRIYEEGLDAVDACGWSSERVAKRPFDIDVAHRARARSGAPVSAGDVVPAVRRRAHVGLRDPGGVFDLGPHARRDQPGHGPPVVCPRPHAGRAWPSWTSTPSTR